MDIYKKIFEWVDSGKKAALATVIQKQGSALWGVGSRMGISSDLEIAGSISGGCVEGAVIQEALNAMKTGQTTIVEYGISDDEAWSVGLTCGGQVNILLQPVEIIGRSGFSLKMLRKIIELKASDKTFCLLTDVSEKTRTDSVILSDGKLVLPKRKPHWMDNAFMEEVKNLERTETSGIIKNNFTEIFADFSFPKPRMVIIGAVHIAQSLVKMARVCGFTTVIIDPRRAFATLERFQEVDQMLVTWPADGLGKVGLNDRDFFLALSHDDKLDLPALQMAMERKVRYIGMLSSRKTRESRFELLKSEGFSMDVLGKIHAPVGMDLGARSPEEIALSIIAEIIAFRYGKGM